MGFIVLTAASRFQTEIYIDHFTKKRKFNLKILE